jgi:hypothetical protein
MVRFCLTKARECRRGAEQATVPSRIKSWVEMEGLWFYLARSYDSERRAGGLLHVSAKTESKEHSLGPTLPDSSSW